MRIGVVCGLKSEAACLPKDPSLLVGISGADADGAAWEAERLVAEGARVLVSFGLAAGLDPAMRPGTLVCPRIVRDTEGRDYLAAHLLGDEHGDKILLGVERVVTSADDKAELTAGFGAAILDMESHRVAEVAEGAGVPFGILRAICDPAERGLPEAAANAVRRDGGVAVGKVLLALLRRPGDLAELGRLARDSRAAQKALRAAALRLLPA